MSVGTIVLTRDTSVRKEVEDAVFLAMDHARRCGTECEYKPLQERYSVVLGRNRAVATFLQTDYSHLLFVDDDVVVPPNTITALLECDADIAGGCYVMLQPVDGRVTPLLTVFDGYRWVREWFDGIVEATQVATGCMMIRRGVFGKVGNPGEWFRWPSWVENGVIKHRSDDVEFCRQALNSGFTIKAHGNVRCGHLRTIDLGTVLPGRASLTQESYTSHRPTLERIGREFNVKTVTEYGAGYYSTPLFLDRDVFPHVRSVVSYENDELWIDRVLNSCPNDGRLEVHRCNLSEMPDRVQPSDLTFIDCDSHVDGQRPNYDTRAELIRRCSGPSGIVVVHDAQELAIKQAVETAPYRHKVVIKNRGLPETAVMSNENEVGILERQELVNA